MAKKRDKKVALRDQGAIEKLNYLAPLYNNADLEEVLIKAVNCLWKAKCEQVEERLSKLSKFNAES